MSQTNGLNRRAFLRNAGITALAGAVTCTHSPGGCGRRRRRRSKRPADTLRFRHRLQPVRHRLDQVRPADPRLRQGQRAGRHGHRRHRLPRRAVDHQGAQGARQARELGLPRHGRVDAKVTEAGRRLEQAALRRRRSIPSTLVLADRRAPGAHRRAQDLLAEGHEGAAADADLQRLLQRPDRFTRDDGRGEPAEVRQRQVPMDFEDFERRISHDTNTFILCNPQNPTGNCWIAEDLLQHRRDLPASTASSCSPTRSTATGSARARSTRRLPACRTRRSSTTASRSRPPASRSASRRTRLAWFYSTNPELMSRVKVNHRADLNTLGIVANQAAYRRRRGVAAPGERVHRRQPRLRRQLRQRQDPDDQGTSKPQGTYLTWLDVTGGRRAHQLEAAGRRLQPHQARRTSPALTPETDGRALLREDARRCT